MNRIHLFEFTDCFWYPQTFRRMQTDYLQFAAGMGSGHKNLVPLFIRAMQPAGTTEILDLCSGGGEPWLRLREHFRQAGLPVNVTLTDKYPDPASVQQWACLSPGAGWLRMVWQPPVLRRFVSKNSCWPHQKETYVVVYSPAFKKLLSQIRIFCSPGG